MLPRKQLRFKVFHTAPWGERGETLVGSGHVCPTRGALAGILSILSLRECGICCHQNKPETKVKFCQRRGKRIHLIVEIQVAVGFVVWFSYERYIL